MIGRVKPPANHLIVTFERHGEQSVSTDVPDGRTAIIRAAAMLLANSELRPGDRLTVEVAD
jgi:hypothetical protein